MLALSLLCEIVVPRLTPFERGLGMRLTVTYNVLHNDFKLAQYGLMPRLLVANYKNLGTGCFSACIHNDSVTASKIFAQEFRPKSFSRYS